MTINQNDKYEDANATCVDSEDGALEVQPPLILSPHLDTSTPTPPNEPIILTFVCVDRAGNRVERQRRVHVLKEVCGDISAQTGMREHVCPSIYPFEVPGILEDPECSVYGICSVDEARIDPDPENAPLPAASTLIDAIPPTINLVGMKPNASMDEAGTKEIEGVNGQKQLKVVYVLREQIEQGEKYVEPGYQCTDQTDGDISNRVSVYGSANVDTSRVTAEPYVIRYTCIDRAGYHAVEVQRWISVIARCSDSEIVCSDGSCSMDGLCVSSEPDLEDEVVLFPDKGAPFDKPPTIALNGDAYVIVDRQGYQHCTNELEVTATCDKGSLAYDDVDGDLTPYIKVCGLNFMKHGLSGCNIHGENFPGEYNVTFSVLNSAGNNASVTRTVKILVQCDAGDVRCADGLTCVPDGIPCMGDVESAIEDAAEPPTPRPSPNITVLGDRSISLPRFTRYETCEIDQMPTKDLPCDLGADAYDSVDGNLQNGVLICPPDFCVMYGCPGHELWRKGVASCVNPLAPVGTVFNVTFTVINSAGVLVSGIRTVTISPPCNDGQNWCPENSPKGRCEDAKCETVDAMLLEDGKPPLLITDVALDSTHSGPDIVWRTPPADEMPLSFVFGQTPWKELRGTTSGSPVTACDGEVRNMFYPMCMAYAHDAIDGDVTETIGVYTYGTECSPSVFAKGLCPPGRHYFYVSAYDHDGNRGYGDVALSFEIVQGWEERYETFRDGPCEIFLDPRIEDSIEVRADVARTLAVRRGRVRIRSCKRQTTQSGVEKARIVLDVVHSFYDDGQNDDDNAVSTLRYQNHRHRRNLRQDNSSGITLLRVGPDSADPRGSWYANQQAKILSFVAEDYAVQSHKLTIATNLTAQHASVMANNTNSAHALEGGFDEQTFVASLTQHLAMEAHVDHHLAAYLKEQHDSSIAASTRRTRGGGGGGRTSSDNARIISLINQLNFTRKGMARGDGMHATIPQDLIAPSFCRGDFGSRLSFYNISSPVARMTNKTGGLTATKTSHVDITTKLKRRAVHRKLLVHGKSRSSILKPYITEEKWGGYDTLRLMETASRHRRYDENEKERQFVHYSGYTRPRVFGVMGQLRLIGGVLITQRRNNNHKAGCRRRNQRLSSRFENFFYNTEWCSSSRTTEVGAFGVDPTFQMLKFPPSLADTAIEASFDGKMSSTTSLRSLYKSALREKRDAYFNASEIADNNLAYAYFSRNHEDSGKRLSTDMQHALFDVYLDGALMQERAKVLISHLYLARFVDSKSQVVDVRAIFHNKPLDVLVDFRVRMHLHAHGKMSITTEAFKVPLFDYFRDGSMRRLGLFIVEVIVAAVGVLLFASSIGDFRRFVHLLHDSIIRRLQQRVVHRHFMVDAWSIAVQALQLTVPLCLLAANIVHFVYYFAYVRDFTYERNYRWYDGDGSAGARMLLPKRRASPQPPVEGYPMGAWRHTLPTDTSERDAFLALLEKVDVMSLLNGWYLVLQVPILLGIASMIARHFFGLSMMYPYMRTLHRGLSDFATVIGVITLCTVLCAYSLHIIIGDRISLYDRFHRAVGSLAVYYIGDPSSNLSRRVNPGVSMLQGTKLNQAERFVVAIVHVTYPLIAIFVLANFLVAILHNIFVEERRRQRAKRQHETRHETSHDKLARRVLRTHGALDRTRDTISALLYAVGFKTLAAFFFSSNRKWLDCRNLHGFSRATSSAKSDDDRWDDFTSPPPPSSMSITVGQHEGPISTNGPALQSFMFSSISHDEDAKCGDDESMTTLKSATTELAHESDTASGGLWTSLSAEGQQFVFSTSRSLSSCAELTRALSKALSISEIKVDVTTSSTTHDSTTASKPVAGNDGGEEDKAATVIQANDRRYLQAKHNQREDGRGGSFGVDLTTSSTTHDSTTASKPVAGNDGGEEDKAATVIQANVRGYIQRKPLGYAAGSLRRWRRVHHTIVATQRAKVKLEKILSKHGDVNAEGFQVAKRRSSTEEEEEEVLLMGSSTVRKDGLRSDTARYLRMNQTNRYELVAPVLGVLGPTALAEVMRSLFDNFWAARALQESSHVSPLSLTLQHHKNRGGRRLQIRKLSAMEEVLYSFASFEDYTRMISITEHLQEAKRLQVVRDAILQIANRVVHDIGSPTGSEYDQLSGDALVSAVLRRARDTAKGMSAVSRDMIHFSEPLPVYVKDHQRDSQKLLRRTKTSTAMMMLEIKRFANSCLPSSLFRRRRLRTGKSDVVEHAWRFGKGMAVTLSHIPWRMFGILLNLLRGRVPFAKSDDDGDGADNERSILGGADKLAAFSAWGDENAEMSSSRRRFASSSSPRGNVQRFLDVMRGGE